MGRWLLNCPKPKVFGWILCERDSGACRRQSSQGQDQAGPLLPGLGAMVHMPKGQHTPTTMPASLEASPGASVPVESRTFFSFVKHFCVFRTPSRKQEHASPWSHLSTALICGFVGGEFTTEELVRFWVATLKGFGKKSWGKRKRPQTDPHFALCSHHVC